jgi:hypothetical protein
VRQRSDEIFGTVLRRFIQADVYPRGGEVVDPVGVNTSPREEAFNLPGQPVPLVRELCQLVGDLLTGCRDLKCPIHRGPTLEG